jgi:hypothetical protein
MKMIDNKALRYKWQERAPWFTEPSFAHWERAGSHCVILRMKHGGNHNGYVGVTSDHPLYRVGYSDRVATDFPWREQEVSAKELGVIPLLLGACSDEPGVSVEFLLPCHGGITYSANALHDHSGVLIGPDELFWFGFDTAHSGDVRPTEVYREEYSCVFEGDEYRDWAYVEGVVNGLADRLALLRSYKIVVHKEVLSALDKGAG